MKSHRVRYLAAICGVAGASIVPAACSSRSSPTESTGRSPENLTAPPVGSEEARIQAFLDHRYSAKDVRHSFKTKLGERIDCIDFFAQPAVKSMAAKGTAITQLPTPPPAPTSATSGSPDVAFHGEPDDEGQARACPDGSVPMLHVSVADVKAAGGLDAFERSQHGTPPVRPPLNRTSQAPPPVGAFCTAPFGPDITGYAHVQQTYNPSNNGTLPPQPAVITKASATLSLPSTPSVANGAFDHDLSQVWMYAGYGFNNFGCTCTTNPSLVTATNPPCTESVEAGWDIDPTRMTRSGKSNPNAPYFFIFATNDGYQTGCYDNINDPTIDGTCDVPFTVVPGATIVPQQQLTTPLNLVIEVELSPISPGGPLGWWISAGSTFVGYYAASSYSGMMQTAAQTFQSGGEIHDSTAKWVVPMGSGANPLQGAASAAYVEGTWACPAAGSCFTTIPMLMTRPSNYTYAIAHDAVNRFYFGNGNALLPGLALLH